MPDWWAPVVGVFVDRAQEFLRRAPVQPTSWWRTRTHNAAVGGHPRSQHLLATALDVVPTQPVTYAQLADVARRCGLVPVIEGDHLHVQLFNAGEADAYVDRVAVA